MRFTRSFRLDDLANRLAVLEPTSQRRLDCLTDLHNCDLLVLDDFLTTPVPIRQTEVRHPGWLVERLGRRRLDSLRIRQGRRWRRVTSSR